MRHGNAKTYGASTDAVRDLSDVGKNEAIDSATFLLSSGIIPDSIICSHANRAQQTARIVADTIGYDAKRIAIERAIYYTDNEDVLEVIDHQNDAHSTILLVGHNPTISNLARKFHPALYQSLPPATIAVFKSNIDKWDDWGSAAIDLLHLRAPYGASL